MRLSQICFYFNIIPAGCRKPPGECDYAHVYVEGAEEARRLALAGGVSGVDDEGQST